MLIGAAVLALGGISVGLTQNDNPEQATASLLPTTWTQVVYDNFNSGTTYPSHWTAYSGHYRANCASPLHDTVYGGSLHLKLSYDASGNCGAGWYSGGLTLDESLSTANKRVTVRFRIVSTDGIQGHRIIPMLNPNDGSGIGEHDFCESTPYNFCSTFLHYGAPGTTQIRLKYFIDLTQWHTFVFTRDGYHITSSIDGVPKMDYIGNETTLPSKLRHVVLQQECNKLGCPTTQSGVEDIQITYIKIEAGS